ncbi:hypothetical protein N9835_00855 [Alphaproteobacteria bacterium]|nr:hypothetical protein [Alphaproteobacteria bacterium]
MENYEINILKRNGDWEKIRPNAQENTVEQNDINHLSNPKSLKDINEDPDLLSNINKVKLIVDKIENLENEKNNLKNSLKNYEMFFLESKTNSEKKLSQISKELEMFDKAIEIIKDLKKF